MVPNEHFADYRWGKVTNKMWRMACQTSFCGTKLASCLIFSSWFWLQTEHKLWWLLSLSCGRTG